MSDNSRPAQVGADNPNIVLFVATGFKSHHQCGLCAQTLDVAAGEITAAHLNGYFGAAGRRTSGIICPTCLAREAPSLHALLKPPFPGTIVKQTVTHHIELADGSVETRTYDATNVETKVRNGVFRLKMRGRPVDEEKRS